MRHFWGSLLVTFICLVLAFWWGGLTGLLIAAILGILEISLSFDNAVINASVLKNWDAFWKMLFLTVGILVAVFGMRLLFPLLIVAQTTDMGLIEVAHLALNQPREYSARLTAHHAEVAAFGGVFLLLVFLHFIFDSGKKHHWLGKMERNFGVLGGRVDSLPIFVALLTILFAAKYLAHESQQLAVLFAGMWGIAIYTGVNLITSLMENSSHDPDTQNISKAIQKGGIGGFLYLEVLDASFSFDGVIGAFAITNDVVIIMLGLGIGAMFVRSITVYLVNKGTLDEYIYLEHGAHYAIGVLAVIMFAGMKYHIPEIITGLIGMAFIGAALWSSIRHKSNTAVF